MPAGEALKALGGYCARMVDDGLLFDGVECFFEELMARCTDNAERANRSDQPLGVCAFLRDRCRDGREHPHRR
ncbi:hypothetical protein MES4922_380001 [Mesorhizobium ventifaucium]|uniref:Uncharacterized protein n=1 Tax=Mesorhizobium ventifaucium TaxID=666020 RepID=A0ABN8K877_9HYPH|nr:hypothetical protein MES4922_380001 [Mesorhizobium ventifaucium]